MPNRDKVIKAYLTHREKTEFSEMAEKADKSQSELLREAVLEYLDKDRTARMEGELREINDRLEQIESELQTDGSHTHKHDPRMKASETVEKTRRIAERLQQNYEEQLLTGELERAIKDIAGGDKRTISKYKTELKERGHAFEHPNPDSNSWYLSRDTYLDELAGYASQTQKPLAVAHREINQNYDFDAKEVNPYVEHKVKQ